MNIFGLIIFIFGFAVLGSIVGWWTRYGFIGFAQITGLDWFLTQIGLWQRSDTVQQVLGFSFLVWFMFFVLAIIIVYVLIFLILAFLGWFISELLSGWIDFVNERIERIRNERGYEKRFHFQTRLLTQKEKEKA